MSQQFINIGTTANDGQGDPLRTAFTKCNDNFTELYAASYSTIVNGTSSVNVLQDSAVTVTVAGTSNVVVVNNNGISVTGNVYAGNAISTFAIQGTSVNASTMSASGNITGAIVKATGSYMVMPTGTSDPAGAPAGAFYYNTSLPALRVYNGSAWVSV